jgi:hypothetical protein
MPDFYPDSSDEYSLVYEGLRKLGLPVKETVAMNSFIVDDLYLTLHGFFYLIKQDGFPDSEGKIERPTEDQFIKGLAAVLEQHLKRSPAFDEQAVLSLLKVAQNKLLRAVEKNWPGRAEKQDLIEGAPRSWLAPVDVEASRTIRFSAMVTYNKDSYYVTFQAFMGNLGKVIGISSYTVSNQTRDPAEVLTLVDTTMQRAMKEWEPLFSLLQKQKEAEILFGNAAADVQQKLETALQDFRVERFTPTYGGVSISYGYPLLTYDLVVSGPAALPRELVAKILKKVNTGKAQVMLSRESAVQRGNNTQFKVVFYMDAPAKPKLGSDSQLRSSLIRLAHSNPALRPHLLPLLAKKKVAATHVEVKNLPDSVRKALKAVGYGSRDIKVEATPSVSLQGVGGEGYRDFAVILDLVSGASETFEGSWGGASSGSSPNLVDSDTRKHNIPMNGAVIKGSKSSGPVYAVLYVNPGNMPTFVGTKVELTRNEDLALAAICGLNSSGRKDFFDRNSLGIYDAKNPLIQSLVSKGLVNATGTGIKATTEGRNAVNPSIHV